MNIEDLKSRLKTLLEYNRIAKKYSITLNLTLINEKLTDCQSVDLVELLPNISPDPSIPDTPICINRLQKDSASDDSPVIAIIDTPITA